MTEPQGDRHSLPPHDAIAVVHHAQSRAEAIIVVGVLEGAGIPAYVDGRFLNDEFAASQAVMNLGSCAVHVPAEALVEAQRVLQEARESGASEPGGSPPSPN